MSSRRKRGAPAAAAASVAAPGPVKKMKAGLGAPAPPVDNGIARLDASIASNGEVAYDEERDCFLAAELEHAGDGKFYVLQAIDHESNHWVYNRWGKTGTSGQSKLEGPFRDLSSCALHFEKAYKAKTGKAWEARAVGAPAASAKKWTHVASSSSSSSNSSSYSVSLSVATAAAKLAAASAAQTAAANAALAASAQRAAAAAAAAGASAHHGFGFGGGFGGGGGGFGGGGLGAPSSVAPATAAVMPSSKKPPPAVAAATISTAAAASAAGVTSGAVDTHAPSHLKAGKVYQGFDCMLNQTNLGMNANKFIKAQLVAHGSSVGSSSVSEASTPLLA